MPKRIPRETVILSRQAEGEKTPTRITPQIGQPFDFTADEIKEIDVARPTALEKVTRVEEDADDDGADDTTAAPAPRTETAKQKAEREKREAADAAEAERQRLATESAGGGNGGKADDDL